MQTKIKCSLVITRAFSLLISEDVLKRNTNKKKEFPLFVRMWTAIMK